MAALQESAFLEPSKLPAPGRASHLLGGCFIHNEVLIAIREKFNLPSRKISIERGVQMQNDWLPVRMHRFCHPRGGVAEVKGVERWSLAH